MTREETKSVLTIIIEEYPQYFKNASMGSKLDIWYEMFADDNVSLVKIALKRLIGTLKYPPTIAEIKECMYSLTNTNEMNTLEAWNILKKSLRHDRQQANAQFEKLPIEIQKAIRNSDSLVEWSTVESSFLETAVYNRFKEMYESEIKRIKIQSITPVKTLEEINRLNIDGKTS